MKLRDFNEGLPNRREEYLMKKKNSLMKSYFCGNICDLHCY